MGEYGKEELKEIGRDLRAQGIVMFDRDFHPQEHQGLLVGIYLELVRLNENMEKWYGDNQRG